MGYRPTHDVYDALFVRTAYTMTRGLHNTTRRWQGPEDEVIVVAASVVVPVGRRCRDVRVIAM